MTLAAIAIWTGIFFSFITRVLSLHRTSFCALREGAVSETVPILHSAYAPFLLETVLHFVIMLCFHFSTVYGDSCNEDDVVVHARIVNSTAV